MKQGVGFSATINIIAVFLVVTIAFLVTSLNYYKAYKVNNAIADSIEKYEGYNALSQAEIENKLVGFGYVRSGVQCKQGNENNHLKNFSYCVYEEPVDPKTGKFKYKIETFISFNIPIVNRILNIPVKTYTEGIYKFSN